MRSADKRLGAVGEPINSEMLLGSSENASGTWRAMHEFSLAKKPMHSLPGVRAAQI